MRYTGNVVDAIAQAQWFANSRQTPRFIRTNHWAFNAAQAWGKLPIKPPPLFQQWFNQAQNWEMALCSTRHLPYADVGPAAPGAWGAPFGQQPFGGVSTPGDTPQLWTSLWMWRGVQGIPQDLTPPPFNTQPGGDWLDLSMLPATPSTPPFLAGAVAATWWRQAVPPGVAYYLALAARSQSSFSAGFAGRQKAAFGAVTIVDYATPVDVSDLLAATGRLVLGAVLVVYWYIGEVGSVPFAGGVVCIRNVRGDLGWGLSQWGGSVWGG